MIDVFHHLGCSETQTKLYLQLLKLGPSIASMLSKRVGIKRVTVYGALEGMTQKGLIEGSHKNNVTYYQACKPEILENLIDRKLDEEKKFNVLAHQRIEELKKLQKF